MAKKKATTTRTPHTGFTLIDAEIAVRIPHCETNHFVELPDDINGWASEMKEVIKDHEAIYMQIDTLSHGCGACTIAFFPGAMKDTMDSLEKGFSLTVSKETLGKIKRAIDFAYKNFNG